MNERKRKKTRNLEYLAFLTPEGRWRILQDWLDADFERRRRLNSWINGTPEEVFPEIREMAAEIATEKYGPLAGLIARQTVLTPEIRRGIEQLQASFKDREGKEREAENRNR